MMPKRLMNILFFHLSLYSKVNCNHVAITINITDNGPDLSLKWENTIFRTLRESEGF